MSIRARACPEARGLLPAASGRSGSLQSRDQFVQCELADVDRRADDLKLDLLEHDIGENRLVQDPPFVDKDFQLTPDA